MTKYMVLIYGDEQAWASMTPEQMGEIDAGHRAFNETAGSAVLNGGQLESASTATTLRRGDGDTPSVTDGPFMETKEVIGGFYVLEAPDLDAAVKLAGLLAEARHEHSGVEVTPLVQYR